jgi:nitroreductase
LDLSSAPTWANQSWSPEYICVPSPFAINKQFPNCPVCSYRAHRCAESPKIERTRHLFISKRIQITRSKSNTRCNEIIDSKVLNVIKQRRSIRDYSDHEIEQEKLDIILESARLAPSATNAQDWFFYVVKSKETREKIAASEPLMANQFLRKAQIVIVGCEKSHGVVGAATGAVLNAVGARGRSWGDVDVTIALEHMVLTATDLGIGSCWVGIFDGRRISRLLDMPEDQHIVALLALGYPAAASTDDSIGGVRGSSRVSLKDISKII